MAIGSDQEHIDKCTLPFLLHLALQAPRLVDQISEKVTDLRKLLSLLLAGLIPAMTAQGRGRLRTNIFNDK